MLRVTGELAPLIKAECLTDMCSMRSSSVVERKVTGQRLPGLHNRFLCR